VLVSLVLDVFISEMEADATASAENLEALEVDANGDAAADRDLIGNGADGHSLHRAASHSRITVAVVDGSELTGMASVRGGHPISLLCLVSQCKRSFTRLLSVTICHDCRTSSQSHPQPHLLTIGHNLGTCCGSSIVSTCLQAALVGLLRCFGGSSLVTCHGGTRRLSHPPHWLGCITPTLVSQASGSRQ
jgi:hypothetical protein